MQNAFDELISALRQAQDVERAAQAHANAMADLLLSNLRKVSPARLEKLKKQLIGYNLRTNKWKD